MAACGESSPRWPERQMGVRGNNDVVNVGFGIRYVYDILRYVQ